MPGGSVWRPMLAETPQVEGCVACAVVLLIAVNAVAWFLWYWHAASVTPLGSRPAQRLLLLLSPLACLVLLLIVSRQLTVAGESAWLIYALLAWLWVAGASTLLPFLGLSARDDVAERKNPAAAWAIGGAQAGLSLCVVGAFIGDTQGAVAAWTIHATALFFVSWAALEWLVHPGEAVTVGRDVAAGCRLGGFLAAEGLLLGYGLADLPQHLDTPAALARPGAPVVLLLFAAAVEAWRPRRRSEGRDLLLRGVLPALVYLGGAVVFVFGRGAS